MKINRHNYEEYFLLYIDNELQPEERSEVESFVAQNPDLSDELNMLQQAVLPQHNVSVISKEALYKKEAGISPANYEENFLLYIDNELTPKQRDETERFVLQHPLLQEDFTLLKKIKLTAPALAYENKQSLYRYEKIKRLVPLVWMRIGVAATVIGLVALLWVLNQNSPQSVTPAVVNVIKSTPNIQKNIEPDVTNQPPAPLQNETAHNSQKPAPQSATPQPALKKQKEAPQPENIAVQLPKAFEKTEQKNSPGTVVNTPPELQRQQQVEEMAQVPVIKEDKNNNLKADNIIQQARNQPLNGPQALVSNAVYREIDTNEEDRNLYIGSASINKNKLKGFFKKAARLLGKNNSDGGE